jgi:ribonuclease D
MTILTSAAAVAEFCARLHRAPFVTVDTEFMRETTYWPKLCLLQLAGPDEEAAIDPLAEGMDLAPVHRLMADPAVLKVFHAARQDIEIFVQATGKVPTPLFDTQVAGMVCGFGDQVSYDTLVSKLAHKAIDKSSRFTDWSHRPLTERQVAYALADVTHLRVVYQKLERRIERSGRSSWLAEEMATLTDPATYVVRPEDAYKRLRSRRPGRRMLAILREVAAWREREAQRRNLPRNRVVRDEALLEIAAHAPTTVAELARTRSLGRSLAEGPFGAELLAAVARGLALPEEECPEPETEGPGVPPPPALVDLLKVLLKQKCDEHHVAAKLVASAADLDRLALGRQDVPALHGWRREVFGEAALALAGGRMALSPQRGRVELVTVETAQAAEGGPRTRTNPLGQPIGWPVKGWSARPRPPRSAMEGRTCRIEPIDPARHAGPLFDAFAADREGRIWTYLPYGPFADAGALSEWMSRACLGDDPLFHAIVEAGTGRALGMASYLRIDPAPGVIEVGHINYAPALQRTPAATEAMYLMMRRVFDELGYRRYEWKCDALNEPSRRAALRLGFRYEGLFRQATIYKGRNRDTAWYSILDREWPRLRKAFETWLSPGNFDASGRQRTSLSALTRAV